MKLSDKKILLSERYMRSLAVLLLLCVVSFSMQQALMKCGVYEVRNGNTGQLTKYRVKPKTSGNNAPGYCLKYRIRRRLQSAEPLCGYRRLAKSRKLQSKVTPYYCPVVNGHQCKKC